MKKRKGIDLAAVLPILTVVCTFAAVGIILMSVLDKREDRLSSSPPGSDVVPGVNESVYDPTESSEASTRPGTENVTAESTEQTADQTEPAETEPPPVQTIPVGIYTKSGKKLTRVSEYRGAFPSSDSDDSWIVDDWTYPDRKNLICDLESFAVLTSFEESIQLTYWDETWVDRWNICGLDETYKIGFEFLIRTKDGGERRFTVLSPSDTFKEEEFFELYLYDCVAHAHDSWYSHITEKTNYDDTRNVMIKITLRSGCYDIDEIVMTAFVYGGADEFDADGFYRGANKASCVIRREEE